MSKLKSVEEIMAGWDKLDRPKDGQIFEHYKGGRYEIVGTGYLEDSEALCVIYRSLEKNIIGVRTAKNFLEQVERNGSKVPRFRPLEK